MDDSVLQEGFREPGREDLIKFDLDFADEAVPTWEQSEMSGNVAGQDESAGAYM